MIIDFHVHTFPDKIAERALDSLSAKSGTKYYLNGTLGDLEQSMRAAGIAKSVLLPVATSGKQHSSINETAYRINERTEETGILSFGGIHPENTNYKEIIRDLRNHGVKGIKLHPVYQGYDLDSVENMRIIEYACEQDMIIVVHAGYDVGLPGFEHALPKHVLPVIEKLHPKKLVLAHMGGWGCWDAVEEHLAGQEVYFDTSFSLNPLRSRKQTTHAFVPGASFHGFSDPEIDIGRSEKEQISMSQFVRLVEKHGAEHILFGSDSPWSPQDESVQLVKASGICGEDLENVLYRNAEKLLSGGTGLT